ncbi:hypothetical protein GN956_G12348 [Arapaima gigas]
MTPTFLPLTDTTKLSEQTVAAQAGVPPVPPEPASLTETGCPQCLQFHHRSHSVTPVILCVKCAVSTPLLHLIDGGINHLKDHCAVSGQPRCRPTTRRVRHRWMGNCDNGGHQEEGLMRWEYVSSIFLLVKGLAGESPHCKDELLNLIAQSNNPLAGAVPTSAPRAPWKWLRGGCCRRRGTAHGWNPDATVNQILK